MNELDYRKLKVLVIDDQTFVRSIIKRLLQQLGFNEIEEAEDGASGIEAHNRYMPDLVICDIEMEPVDGLVFLQTVREAEDSKKSNAKVVFLTQHADSEIVNKARALNVDGFIIKPPSFDKLRDRIGHVMGNSK